MACFLVPATEAIVTTVATKIIENRENKTFDAEVKNGVSIVEYDKERFSNKLKRLNYLLYGGSLLLAFEHLWHGEIQPFFPFLTAASNPEDAVEMLHEMSTIGVTMAVLTTAVWGLMTFVISKASKKVESVNNIK